MSKYTEDFPNLSTYDFDTIMCQLKQVCGADPSGLINAQFLSRPTTAKDIALLLHITYELFQSQVELQKQFVELYTFVKDFFENLDLQEEVNNWLNENLLPYFDDYITEHFPDFELIERYCTKYPKIYTETEMLNEYEGFSETSLINWTVKETYSKFDAFLGVHDNYVLEKTTLGYANNSDNDGENTSLPIICYSYKPQMGTGVVSQRKKIILTGSIHGNEKFGAFMMLKLLSQGILMQKQKIVNNIMGHLEIDFIPIVNPYGYNQAVNTNINQQLSNTGRYNARGIDLNRNFPYGFQFYNGDEPKGSAPLTEQETKAMDSYFKTVDWDNVILYLDLHQTWQSMGEPISKLVTMQVFSNDERLRGVFTDVWNDSNKFANDIGVLLQDQSNVEGASIGESEGWMIFDACHQKKNFFNVGLIEGGKGIYSNNQWDFYAKELLSLFLTYTITSIERLIDLCYYDNNTFIDPETFALSDYIGNLLPLDWNNYENVIYNDNVIANVTYNANRIFLKVENAIHFNHSTQDINLILNSEKFEANIYSLDSSKENIVGNKAWGVKGKITDLTTDDFIVGFRNKDNTTINMNRLFKEFMPMIYVTNK